MTSTPMIAYLFPPLVSDECQPMDQDPRHPRLRVQRGRRLRRHEEEERQGHVMYISIVTSDPSLTGRRVAGN